MVEFDTNVRIAEMQKRIDEVRDGINRLLEIVKPDQDLWDNADIIKNWKVSERTLAGWRADGKISFTQIGNKIFYTIKDRKSFIEKYHVNLNR